MSEQNDKGFFNNIIDSIVSGYEKLIKIFKKHGILYSIFLMVIFICLWTLIINPIRIDRIVEKRLEKQQTEQNEKVKEEKEILIERRYKANEICGDIMAKLLYKYHANRVLLLEKSNGTKSLGNVDFLYLSATLEFIDPQNPNTDYISQDLQRRFTVNLMGPDMIALLKHSKYLYYPNLQEYDKNNCQLFLKLKKEGEKECLIYPFSDSKHRPLLILVVCGENLNVKEIVDYIDEFSKQITDLLIYED